MQIALAILVGCRRRGATAFIDQSAVRFLVLPVALTCCATAGREATAAKPSQLQLKAFLEHQDKLERRLDVLEARLEALATRASTLSLAPGPPSSALVVAPAGLATVRLAPPRKRPTPISTAVELKEPLPDRLATLLDPDAEARSSETDIATEFELALEALRQGDVTRGASTLVAIADGHPRDELAPRALFTAGAGLQSFGDLYGALQALSRVADDYPLAPEAPAAMVKMGECNRRLKRDSAAREAFTRVIKRYPRTPAAHQAEEQLKNLDVPRSSEP